ncbi:hypothetical protein SERLA73DRAFT_120152 [Serpula lacrymans var. lacrymans S7.3]|uniref:Protein BIG1 n=2 Tax=Serpula lacrymans var. lacrymans TaxID=341189 RepID=F8PQ13_SERL3|nr:uncharacterized protein SERLADRAFT_366665 [Serpula lacrymans var. lacrymans S7.9]EGO01478.1 hypothetical protein SERLA73DRAFT_120152 [Serpula lacrymans var. lacrymans S7.3]EGO27139.1 hypothetical protein SERLADRAFT_366665 [Serpula lacrymans var. lacrymans S7.9]
MASRAIILASLFCAAGVSAFSDTSPFVAWSSHKSDVLELLPVKSALSSDALLGSIFSHNDICDYDAIVVIDQPGLRSSDLRTLPASSILARSLSSAPSSRQFQYMKHGPSSSLADVAEMISSRCGSRRIDMVPGQGAANLEEGPKHVVCMNMPHLEESVEFRKASMLDHESRISSELANIGAAFPKHLVVLTGSPVGLFSRQASGYDSPAPELNGSALQSHADFKAPAGGILKRYQLLTPALITTLLITFFVLVPIVMLGVSTLSSIQSPLRLEAPKGYNAQEKKVQ